MSNDKHYESKSYMGHWTERQATRIRIATIHEIDPKKLAEILHFSDRQVAEGGFTGMVAIEINYKLGEARRIELVNKAWRGPSH